MRLCGGGRSSHEYKKVVVCRQPVQVWDFPFFSAGRGITDCAYIRNEHRGRFIRSGTSGPKTSLAIWRVRTDFGLYVSTARG